MSHIQFTPRLRTVLAVAREEAHRLRHEYIGTEHILLALLRDPDGVAATVLRQLDVSPDAIRQKIDETVTMGREATPHPDLPYTSRTKKVLELTLDEARRAGAAVADTEHLLLGLCAEERGIGAQVLAWAGLTTDKARAEVARLGGAT
jgi:ATP-dependent Clp protease ATP-binding subunit ClpC